MKKKNYNFASYNLLNLHSPAVGQEVWHCDMKRGFYKARKKEEEVKALLNIESIPQRIGLLAQEAVYEFHQPDCDLDDVNSILKVKEKIKLAEELPEVQNRVEVILEKYQKNPVLKDKEILSLSRGDEGYPQPIVINDNGFEFNLYAAVDCIVEENNGVINIIDLKTGTSDFDTRQGYIYLLAAQYLYPYRQAVASFYNLEKEIWSETLTATQYELMLLQERLKKIAQKHQSELKSYRFYKQEFD